MQFDVISELARTAKEARVFPLMDAQQKPCASLGPLLLALQKARFGTEIRSVNYSLYPEGKAMLRVWAQTCSLI